MDMIKINGIKLYGYHGVLQAERDIGQYFIVDVVLYVDLEAARKSDDLTDTINYVKENFGSEYLKTLIITKNLKRW